MTSSSELTEILRQWMDLSTTRSMREWSHFVKSTGLSMPQFGILMHLHYHRNCGLSQISERMDISAAAASQLVDRLVQHGLVERTEDQSDRRAKQLTLTPQGHELIKTGIAERSCWVDELADSLNPDDFAGIASTLALLTETVRKLENVKTNRPDDRSASHS